MSEKKELGLLSVDQDNLCAELSNQLAEVAETLIDEGFYTGSEVIELVRQAVERKEAKR